MPVANIEKELLSLEEKKKRLQLKEKLIRERERRRNAKRFEEVGRLAGKAEITAMEDVVLLGAFLEIGDKQEELRELWRKKGEVFLKEVNQGEEGLIVSFSQEPEKEVVESLKAMGFKWNRFRKEYYGYGTRRVVEGIVSSASCKVEVVE